eukprot:gene37269-8201_t
MGCLALVARRRAGPQPHGAKVMRGTAASCGGAATSPLHGDAGSIEAHLRPVDVWHAGHERALLIEQADRAQGGGTLHGETSMRDGGVWEFLSDAAAAGMGGGDAAALGSSQIKHRENTRAALAGD